jgi:hypothetical protein
MKILVGITFDDEIYFLEIKKRTSKNNYIQKKDEQDYFSMSGETVAPLEYSKAVEQSREILEDGEFWKMAVEAGNTELGLTEWIDYVLDTDGKMSMIDNSLYPETITANGEDYIFESGSCGQHEEKDLKEYFLPKKTFHQLMRIWKKYHLKKVNPEIPSIPFRLRNDEGIKETIQNWLEGNQTK